MACSALWETPNQTRSDKGDNPETTHVCNRKQVQLPASTETSTQEVGADVKESGLFSGASHLEDRVLTSQSPSPGKMGDSCFKVHLLLSVEAEVSERRQRGTEQRDQGRGFRSSLRADDRSPFR